MNHPNATIKGTAQVVSRSAEHVADAGAATAVAAASYVGFFDPHTAAAYVAIVSGSLAAAWHIYKFYEAWREKRRIARGNQNESKTHLQPGTADERPGKAGSVEGDE